MRGNAASGSLAPTLLYGGAFVKRMPVIDTQNALGHARGISSQSGYFTLLVMGSHQVRKRHDV